MIDILISIIFGWIVAWLTLNVIFIVIDFIIERKNSK